jgi:hypothetical protein
MHLFLARAAMTLTFAVILANIDFEPKAKPFARFEPPRSIGTPIEDLARNYSGVGLADRIEGRLRLESDKSLTTTARRLIRQRLAQGS